MKLFIARIKALFRYKDLIGQLVTRDIKLKYRRSFLGYLWSVLNPLSIMIVLTIVFSKMFNRNISNFPVYLISGQIMFNYMSQSTQQAIHSIVGNSSLLKKTYLPKYIFTLSKVTSGFVDFLFSMGALVIVMIATKCSVSWHIILFPVITLELYVFCLGLGMFLAQANVFFRDIQYIYSAVIAAWMYLTPLFYPLTMLPDNIQWVIKRFNPMYMYVTQFRDILLNHQIPGWKLFSAGAICSLIALVVGVVTFSKKQDKFILYI